ncbi:MAG: hypothetical protein WC862_01165 [Patescibacteria group bacterium]
MEDEYFDQIKKTVLEHVQQLFEEMEEEMAISHQEKYALLEDSFESATDPDELRVAFEQWYNDHADEIDFGQTQDELWEQAVGRLEE